MLMQDTHDGIRKIATDMHASRTTVTSLRRFLPIALALIGGAWAARPLPRGASAPTVVTVRAGVLDTMGLVFERFNRNWDQQQDLNTLERMLGTTRPVTLEYLGCLQGEVRGDTVVVDGWLPARRLRQLPQAVTGRCDSLPRVVGTWHTHPYRPDTLNRPIKAPSLSAQDLQTFAESPWAVSLVLWDVDSVDAATKNAAGDLRHPAAVSVVRTGAP